MADYLYVCHFSNGHIKVGRSIDPLARIAAHVDRVACLGVELVENFVVECAGPSEPRETRLIAKCVEQAERRNQNEWFVGLYFSDVCSWAQEAANHSFSVGADEDENQWPRIISELRESGLTQVAISQLCKTPTNNISRLATGTTMEPGYSLGVRIISLHRARVATPAEARHG